MRPYVIKLNHKDDITYEQEFSCSVVSCGFKNKIKIMPTINEKIEIGEKLEVSVKKFRTLIEGPILVSDESGNSLTSGSFQGTVVNGNITAGTINFNNTYKIETNTKTALNINIGNIVSMVDSNITYTIEEKSQVKDTLTKITNLISATGSTAVKVTYHFWLTYSNSTF